MRTLTACVSASSFLPTMLRPGSAARSRRCSRRRTRTGRWLWSMMDRLTEPARSLVGFDLRIRLIRQANAGVSRRGIVEPTNYAARPPPPIPLPQGEGEWRRVLSPAPCGRGLGGGGRLGPCTLDADDLLAPDALSRLVAALDASPSAVAAIGAYAFVDTAMSAIRPPAIPCAACWWAICSPTAATSSCAVKQYARSAASSPASPTARIGNSGSGSLSAAHSSRLRVVCQCYSSASSPAGHIIAWPPIQPPSHPVWKRSSAIRLCLPASVPGASPQSADAPKLRTIGSSAVIDPPQPWARGPCLARCSVRAAFSVKRAALFAAAHMLPLLLPAWRGRSVPIRGPAIRARTLSAACRPPLW